MDLIFKPGEDECPDCVHSILMHPLKGASQFKTTCAGAGGVSQGCTCTNVRLP